ncbi:MAG: Bro-N domain-containing protein [Saprospiraceae bacterium]|nr:Bro-N domain-containing protein [Saprospiraceae bacterium]
MEEAQNKLAVFQEKEIRRVWYKGEWWFSIVDVIEALSESPQPSRYWNELRARMQSESGNDELFANTEKLKMKSLDGKMRGTEAANTESMFRLIQSIPSPKAEPFKQWLAKVGYERIQEIENPELAAERARQYYRALGYSEDWIAKRLQSIEIRGKLTDEWKLRDVKKGLEYAILTAEISKATFGLTPSEYVKLKDLKRENLRDHMTDLELIFTMLGETATRNEVINRDAKGFIENKAAAQEGGAAAGDALEAFEKRTGSKVVTERNFKQQIAEAKKQKELGDGKEE